MTKEKYNRIYNQAIVDYETIDIYRKGQCLFNLFALEFIGESWFDDLIGTNKDPFYNDNNINNFLSEIKKHIKDE